MIFLKLTEVDLQKLFTFWFFIVKYNYAYIALFGGAVLE